MNEIPTHTTDPAARLVHGHWRACGSCALCYRRRRGIDAGRADHGCGVAVSLGWLSTDGCREPDLQLVAAEIPLLAWYALAIFGLAALLRRRAHPSPRFGPKLALAMGAVPRAAAVRRAWWRHISIRLGSWAKSIADGCLYAVVLGAWIARHDRLYPARQRACACFAFILAFGRGPATPLDAIPELWAPTEAQSAVLASDTLDAESILFEQADFIDRSLEAVRPRDLARKPRAFFLGFARGRRAEGVRSGNRVGVKGARRESATTSATAEVCRSSTIEARPGDGSRSRPCPRPGDTLCLGCVVAHESRPGRALFLSISSHGTEDPAIVVSNAQLPLNDLTGEDLADALRESGIRWRVIIISACYAGGFIDSAAWPADHRHRGGGRPIAPRSVAPTIAI